MILIVCGGRDYTDKAHVYATLDRIDAKMCIDGIVEGGQRTRDPASRKLVGGADYWAMCWAKERGVPFDTMAADWKRWGGAAGPIRNGEMLRKWKPQGVLAFKGRAGTEDMKRQARDAGVPVMEA